MPRQVIFDCDPGGDDAVALLTAFASPEDIKLLGITTVAGNVPVAQTEKNARMICELGGITNIPVFAGSPRALLVPSYFEGEACHGTDGMGGAVLPDPKLPKQSKHGVDFIVETLLASTSKLTLAVTGPQTNIAMALIKAPEILDHIDEIVFMGGSLDFGNITPSAEYNLYSDPHAANVVLKSGAKITMFGLNATHQLCTTLEEIQKYKDLGSNVGIQVANMLEHTLDWDVRRFGLPGRAIHDAAVTVYLLRPDLFEGQDMRVEVEIMSETSMGRTIASPHPAHNENPNVHVMTKVHTNEVLAVIHDRLARFR